ncbi:MAG TPA: NAD(P)/FAD-dependent oxidoreductase [Candidatus Polarisedimenticolia bacterium]|nr:NAD(P)/FAD-dependent oxidoreductase [Candidatus Polarisedimenticolia bacterium]
MSRVFDVLVVGGGPAGSTVATHLARAGRAVLLVDAARFPRHKICGEYVPPAALRSFAALGVLEEVERLGPRRHVGMAVIAPDGTEVLGRYGEGSARGFSLRRYDLDLVLIENAGRAGAQVLQGWRVVDLARAGDGLFDLTLVRTDAPGEDRRSVRARAIVGADGRNSLVARRLGLRRREPRHRRFAVMGHFRGVQAPGDHGEMIVTPYGYCGINPLPDGLANVALVVDPSRQPGALPGRAALPAFFRERLESHPLLRLRMAGATLAEGLWATGPIACRSARAVADGAILVGDAAGFYDPFTGEGIGMALRGGEMAAEVLLAALRRGRLDARALSSYEAGRRAAFGARLRLDRSLQALLLRPRLTDWFAGKLRREQGLADLLARVTGDTAPAGDLLRPGFVARLLRA